MGTGNSKSTNFSKQVARDITELHTETIMSSFSVVDSSQEMNIHVGACTLRGVNVTQEATFKLDIQGMQDAATSTDITAEMEAKLKQKAETTASDFSLRMGDAASTNIGVQVQEMYTDIYSQTRQDCFLNLTSSQRMNLTFDGPGCEAKDVNFTQRALYDAILNCTQTAVTDHQLVKRITADSDQTAIVDVFSWFEQIIILVVLLIVLRMMFSGGSDRRERY